MSGLSDTITLGLVLILVFGSACLYLYTRIQQAETKINLLENILLDIKMSNELKSYPTLSYPAKEEFPLTEQGPAPLPVEEPQVTSIPIKPFVDEHSEVDHLEQVDTLPMDETQPIKEEITKSKANPNYEAMTLDELRALAKQRGLTKISTLRRNQLIESLKQHEDSHVSVLDSFMGESTLEQQEVSIPA